MAREPFTRATVDRFATSDRSFMNLPEYMKTVVIAPGAVSWAGRNSLSPSGKNLIRIGSPTGPVVQRSFFQSPGVNPDWQD